MNTREGLRQRSFHRDRYIWCPWHSLIIILQEPSWSDLISSWAELMSTGRTYTNTRAVFCSWSRCPKSMLLEVLLGTPPLWCGSCYGFLSLEKGVSATQPLSLNFNSQHVLKTNFPPNLFGAKTWTETSHLSSFIPCIYRFCLQSC